MGDAGFWFGLVGAVIAVATLALHYLERRQAVRHDEIAYLQRQVADLKRANDLCESRCEELREEMLALMAKVAVSGPKPRRRNRVAT